MKKHLALPALAVLGGGASFLLRLAQNCTGFEPDTGLPIPGNVPGMALAALLLLIMAAAAILAGRLPKEADPGPAFPEDFSTVDPKLLVLPVMGVLLMALSGAAELAGGLGLSGTYVRSAEGLFPSFSRSSLQLLGLLSLASAAGLGLGVIACRPREDRTVSADTALLIPPAAMVVRLVLTYRTDSVNPALSAYYVELLALIFLTLGFYRLSSFAFQAGRTRRFALYAVPAAALSLAVLADIGTIETAALPLYLGSALTLLGFLLLRLSRVADGHVVQHNTNEE